MSANVAFLTRLSRIVAQSGPDAAQAAGAVALVDVYRHGLYGRLGIVSSCRPTRRAKEAAKDALDDLRRELLRVEIGAPAAVACIYMVARQRIELVRRALDLCIADDQDCDRRGAADPEVLPEQDAAQRGNAPVIAEIRRRLRDRRAIETSLEVIRQSRAMLARFA